MAGAVNLMWSVATDMMGNAELSRALRATAQVFPVAIGIFLRGDARNFFGNSFFPVKSHQLPISYFRVAIASKMKRADSFISKI
jgi:hypothetical protein